MILEKQTETLVLEDGDVSQESTTMEIDKESHVFLMRMLSKFYSDGIGSLIRETCSNALDSHRECGVTDPIIVSFKRDSKGNYEFSVQDFGCGIDDKDVANIISKYGKSTKRLSSNQLGAFGLGFKSPLAYTSSFYFVGRKGGVERKWMLYESEEEQNKIDLLVEVPTTERNGVKIIVPVKYSDAIEFREKIKEQLAYFESVYFDCESIKNDFKIIRHEDFQWSSLADTNELHLCLDNVYYPLDFEKLGISRINLPVGLRFGLSDGIFPVPNREQLKYTKEAKEAILSKIKRVSEYFVTKYNDSVKDGDDIFTIVEYYSSMERSILHPSGDGRKIDVRRLEECSDVKFVDPKLTGLKYLNTRRVYELRDHFLQEYSVKCTFSNGRFNSTDNKTWRERLNFRDVHDKKVYVFTEMSNLKKIYLREEKLEYGYVYFAKKNKTIKLGDIKLKYSGSGYDSYIKILELHKHPRKEWRDRIKEFQYIVSLISKNFIDVDKIDIPQEWLDARKKKRVEVMVAKGTNIRKKKLSGEVTGKEARSLERYVSGKNCKFVSSTLQMNEAHKSKRLTIYGGMEEETAFQGLFSILPSKKVRLMVFSERELKNLKKVDLHNWIEIDKFMEGKHKVFRRAVTAYLIEKLFVEYPNTFNRVNKMEQISSILAEKMKELKRYKEEYHLQGDEDLYKAILEVAEKNKLFDSPMYETYKEVNYILQRLPFVEAMFSKMNYSIEEGLMKATRDLFKYYKQRIDWQHYNLPVNEEVIEEIKQEEEIIDQN